MRGFWGVVDSFFYSLRFFSVPPCWVLVVRACFALVDGFMDWAVLHVEAWEKGFAFVCAG
jgi:hypothetical protein